MKHQYFGDIIDLFKFDLITTLYENLNLSGVFFVPMLTENDKSSDGSKRNYENAKAGIKNTELIEFFKRYDELQNRKATEMKKYFETINIKFDFYSESFFYNKKRNEYFFKLADSSIINQLLFFDPDNGLEVKNFNKKHLLFHEFKTCYDIANDSSVISTIQFRSRTPWEETIKNKQNKMIEFIDSPYVTFIADRNVAFFLATKTERRFEDVENCLTNYKILYPNLLTLKK